MAANVKEMRCKKMRDKMRRDSGRGIPAAGVSLRQPVDFKVKYLIYYLLYLNSCILSLVIFVCACESSLDNGNKSLPLTGPKSVQLTARDNAIKAQWTMVSSAQEVPATYEVYCSDGANPAAARKYADVGVPDKQLVECEISGLQNYVTYYVWVKAVFEGLGESDFSPTVFAVPVPPPPAPGAITVTGGEGMLELSWASVRAQNDITGRDEGIASTYKVYCQRGSGGDGPPSGTMAGEFANTIDISGACIFKLADESPLENGISYTVWVQACNTAGESGYTKAGGTPEAASEPPESAPAQSQITAAAGAKKINLSWRQVSGVPSYKLYYGTQDNFDTAAEWEPLIAAGSPVVNASVTGLHNGTMYYIWIQSRNSKSTRENSPRSAGVSAIPEAKTPLDFNDYQKVIGEATADFIFAVDLPPSVWFFNGRPGTDRLPRFQEAAIGNLYCDGAAWFVRDRFPEDPFDFVFLNSSHIDNAIPMGAITIGTLMNATKADGRNDKLCLITLKGDKLISFTRRNTGRNVDDELEELFDKAANVPHTGHGSSNTGWFPIVSKEARFTIQYYKPPELSSWTSPYEISRGTSEIYYHGWIKDYPYNSDRAFSPPEESPGFKGSLTISGEAIDKNRDYRILTSDYLVKGEWYTIFYTDGRDKKVLDTPVWKAVAEYIYDMEKVSPKPDGRIRIEGGVPLPDPWIPGDLINTDPPAWQITKDEIAGNGMKTDER